MINVYGNISQFQAAKAKGLALNLEEQEVVHISSSRNSCVKYEPSMNEWKQEIVGCIKNHSELFAAHDSAVFTRNLGRLSERLGAKIKYNSQVASFTIKDNKIVSLTLDDGKVIIGDKFILCSGVGSRFLGKQLGWTPPI